MSEINSKRLIIDLGSKNVKFGYSNEEEPSHVFDNIIGKRYFNSNNLEKILYSEIIGKDDPTKVDFYFENILKKGLIQNKEDFNKILEKIFKEMKIDEPSEICVVYPRMLDSPLREMSKICNIFF